ncbi:hypothetical protein GGR28_000596 [Lewinella aquimaris]|uniref:GmrSD restriction endonucleases N-terminal domain-containing protein n=1 Tax=Neolewinella aquimaris TaxID=1835722 RepID=A0A840E2V3_9BACT|nr:DUF262 domain-containing protein [Neolewinella aquimaris]MBB4077995.1 hypothetical protein [Neolewinella aquimaris]
MKNVENSESIKSLFDNIVKKNIVLPEFQRNFVWGIDRTLDLYDSLVKDIFIGAIIYGKPSFEITTREIDDRPRRGKGSRRKLEEVSISAEKAKQQSEINNFRLILDGQQRCTSIYRSLKGVDKVWMILKNENELEDEIIDLEIKDRDLEDVLYEFSANESPDRLSILLSDVFETMDSSIREAAIKTKYYDSLLYTSSIEPEEDEDTFTLYLSYKGKLEDLFKDNKLFNYYMLDMSLEKFALFFERSNSLGIRLNFIDVLSAKLYVGFKLRKEIEEFESSSQKFKPLMQEVMVRAISYLVSNGRDVERSYILKTLNHEHFNTYWNDLLICYKNALNYLYNNKFVTSQSWIPYENMVIPLMIFSFENGKKNFSTVSEDQAEMLEFWYWSSIYSTRYSRSSNEVIVQDSNALKQLAKIGKIKDRSFFNRLIKYQVTNPDDLQNYNSKRSGIYKGTLNFIAYINGGLIGWENTNALDYNSHNLEDHHVFPKGYINNYYKDDEDALSLRDSVVNRTLIPKILNIKVGKKKPSEYLKELEAKNGNLESSLKRHSLPVDLKSGLYDDFYKDFVEERSKAIYDELDELVFSKKDVTIKKFYQEPSKQGSSRMKIYRTYLGTRFEATFNPQTQKVLFEGSEYTVSGAAMKAKSIVKGSDDVTANGWRFWKYIDETIGVENTIDELRE